MVICTAKQLEGYLLHYFQVLDNFNISRVNFQNEDILILSFFHFKVCTLHRLFPVTMSLLPGIESLSHQKPFLLPSPAFEQQVFSQQNRPSIQRRRYLLPTPIRQPFIQHRRNFLPPFRAPHPFILHNRYCWCT
jgi:hypothetical protein